MAQTAQSQAPTPETPSSAATGENADGPAGADIVVTGSRIAQNGNNQPTPVTVVTTDLLQRTTPTSVQDGLVRLPQFNQGAATPNNSVNSNGQGFNTPGNFLNLRNLGAIRTLILQDGNRVPGTLFNTTVDTNQLPQLLIQRVEVVTGGASSVYGSDAVTGVVNFITDAKFTGLKGVAQGGISKYGDAKSVRLGVAYGVNIGDRGHFEASVEMYKRNAVKDTATRPYGRLYPLFAGSGTAALPYRLILDGKQSNVAPGGLAVTGPFAGQQFNNAGVLVPFNPGQLTETTNVAVGGDGGRVENEYLLFDHRTRQGFARFDYEVTDDIKFFVQGRYAENHDYGASQIYTNVSNATNANPRVISGAYPLWIYSGNAYLPAAQQTALTNAGVTSFALNRMNNDLFRQLGLELDLSAFAATTGLSGTFGVGDLAWDVHYTRGQNKSTYTTRNNLNAAKYFAAADAVRDPATGNIVCRVTLTAPGAYPDCAPINLFGQNRSTQLAQDFVFDDTAWTARNTMDDFGANITGTAFDGWAGAIKFALGGQYRHQKLKVTNNVPSNVFNPQYLRLGPDGNSLPTSYPTTNLGYFKEVQSPGMGSADIYEANAEVSVPLLRDLPLVQLLAFNGAGRYAKYKVSGNKTFSNEFSSKTWKLGLEWSVIDGLRLRATRSRDFRAPTLWDLYQTQVISSSGITDRLTGVAGSINTVNGGNPNLTPEIGNNLVAGFVVQPSFLPRFSLSLDYFKIKLKNAIGAINGLNAQVQNICLASDGSSPYCALVQRPISYNSTSPANYPTLIFNVAQNTVRTVAEGIDLEVNYSIPLGDLGKVALRGLYSHQWKLISTSFPGALALNTTGTMAVPKHKINFTVDYRIGRFGFDWLQRYYSAIRYTNDTTIFYFNPRVKAYLQSDVNVSYDIGVGDGSATLFLNVNNLFNAKGGLYQSTGFTGSPGLRYPTLDYADIVGRYYTAGVRFKF